jgi:FkbM family methyltransferase
MLDQIKNYLLSIPAIQNTVFERADRRLIEAGEYMPQIAPSHILDLGAHKGFATVWFAKKFPNAVIHAYEPNPKLFPSLIQNIKKFRNVTVHGEAIAEHGGQIEFYISSNNLSSSLIKTSGEVVRVPAVTIREAAERIRGQRIFCKMDIEGAEYSVLRDIPSSIIEIVGEMHPKKVGKDNEVIKELLSGFSHFEIDPKKHLFRAWRGTSVVTAQ